MSDEKPRVYIFFGDDDFSIQQSIAEMAGKMGDPSLADLNISRLDGRTAGEDDLRGAAMALPFLSERRLVVVDDALARLAGKRRGRGGGEDEEEVSAPAGKQRERFTALLDAIPETTALVLVVADAWSWNRTQRRMEWETLNERHWLVKWAGAAGRRVYLREHRLPEAGEMPGWIRRKAVELGGQFAPAAASELAGQVGNDTRLAAQEIAKLLTYVDAKRPVEADDVALLVAPGGETSVFEMVDALGVRDGRRAIKLLRALEEEQEAPLLFGMIVRQFRLILQARELLEEGVDPRRMAGELRQSPFVAEKAAAQARNFSLTGLEDIYHRLLEIDAAAKSSRMPLEAALEAFVAEVTG